MFRRPGKYIHRQFTLLKLSRDFKPCDSLNIKCNGVKNVQWRKVFWLRWKNVRSGAFMDAQDASWVLSIDPENLSWSIRWHGIFFCSNPWYKLDAKWLNLRFIWSGNEACAKSRVGSCTMHLFCILLDWAGGYVLYSIFIHLIAKVN
jgi:hypothetical protein